MKGFMNSGKNCVEIEAHDPFNLASQLEILTTDSHMREALAERAYLDVRKYLDQFSGEDHADQVIDRFMAMKSSL
jgi:hypothetical protein